MFLQACIPHFDKLSAGFKHLACNLHVAPFGISIKKLLEASGMVFRFRSLQVTFFGISQSDCLKKISSREEKKTRCEAKLTTPSSLQIIFQTTK